jgi:hypothetical protein
MLPVVVCLLTTAAPEAAFAGAVPGLDLPADWADFDYLGNVRLADVRGGRVTRRAARGVAGEWQPGDQERSAGRRRRRPFAGRPGPDVRGESLLAAVLGRRVEFPVASDDASPATPTARVRELAGQGMRPATIAKVVGLSRKDVHSILNRMRKG